jgi:hypothetical protein
MPGDEFFERLNARFALQAGVARRAVGRQAHAEMLISKAEYECQQMRRDLDAAFSVRLTDRVVKVETFVEPPVEASTATAAPTPAPAADTPRARTPAKAA